ncbi:MAG: hypothetical protein WC569_03805 [Candidatus Omnitrophota bacterium]
MRKEKIFTVLSLLLVAIFSVTQFGYALREGTPDRDKVSDELSSNINVLPIPVAHNSQTTDLSRIVVVPARNFTDAATAEITLGALRIYPKEVTVVVLAENPTQALEAMQQFKARTDQELRTVAHIKGTELPGETISNADRIKGLLAQVEKDDNPTIGTFSLASASKLPQYNDIVNELQSGITSLASNQVLSVAKPSLFNDDMVRTISLPASAALASDQASRDLAQFINSGSEGKDVIIVSTDKAELDAARAKLIESGLASDGIEGERLFFALTSKDALGAVETLFNQYRGDFGQCTGDKLDPAVRATLRKA